MLINTDEILCLIGTLHDIILFHILKDHVKISRSLNEARCGPPHPCALPPGPLYDQLRNLGDHLAVAISLDSLDYFSLNDMSDLYVFGTRDKLIHVSQIPVHALTFHPLY